LGFPHPITLTSFTLHLYCTFSSPHTLLPLLALPPPLPSHCLPHLLHCLPTSWVAACALHCHTRVPCFPLLLHSFALLGALHYLPHTTYVLDLHTPHSHTHLTHLTTTSYTLHCTLHLCLPWVCLTPLDLTLPYLPTPSPPPFPLTFFLQLGSHHLSTFLLQPLGPHTVTTFIPAHWTHSLHLHTHLSPLHLHTAPGFGWTTPAPHHPWVTFLTALTPPPQWGRAVGPPPTFSAPPPRRTQRH